MSVQQDSRFNLTTSTEAEFPRTVWNQLADAKHNEATERQHIRQNAALPPDSWEARDDAVYGTMDRTMVLVNALRNAGLTYGNVTLDAKIDTWGLVDDRGSADVRMDPETEHRESSVTFDGDGAPIPVIQDGYSIGFRDNPYDDGRMPQSLDQAQDEVVTRHISETVEEMFVNGSQFGISTGPDGEGYTLYGMTDHPATAKGTTSADWTTDSTVARDDVRAMRAVLKRDRNFNPSGGGYWLALGSDYYDTLDDLAGTDGNQTVRDRIESLASINRIIESEFLAPKSALMFRPTRDVIEVGVAADLTPVQWEDAYRSYRDVIAGMYPRIKQTPDGENGIVYYTA